GLGGAGALDPNNTGYVHNGADDNASGTAALLHIARRLSGNPPARTVVFIAFSGEELGLLGSAHYTKNPVYPLSQSVAMVNLDMVGRLRNDKLIAFGAETATELPALLDSLNWYAGFDLKASGDGYGPSDHSSFYAAQLPVVHLFTDLHEDYHRATDDADKINSDGLVRVADYTANIVQALANRRESLTYVAAPAPKPAARGDSPSGERAWFGSIPDMTGGVTGVRFSGVSTGSPAEKAGLAAGDVLIRLGDHEIADLQAMSDALGTFKPGDEADVVVLRDGEERHFRITFASRADR
ncbi:MAG: M28 family peptidase, partial [Gemmatimonadales bacterium]|nr:M28 family peptidase [Gemmatimonadales bacterium]